MSIGSAVFLKDSFKLEDGGKSNTITVDVVSSVGGRNLLTGSKDYSGTWINKTLWTVSSDTYKGTQIASRTGAWIGLGQRLNVFKGEQYTFSAYVKSTTTSVMLYISNYTDAAGVTPTSRVITLEANTWTYVVCPISVSSDGLILPRFEQTSDVESVYVSAMKLEKGNKATDWTPAPEDISEDSNHPLIYKTNISLSEPLRSVGDVKDKLFRDSDGLWKIQRFVGEIVLNPDLILKYPSIPVAGLTKFYTTEIGNGSSLGDSYKNNSPLLSNRFKMLPVNMGYLGSEVGISTYANNTALYGALPTSLLISDDQAGLRKWFRDNQVAVLYQKQDSTIETLSQELQDKLNNIASFKDSNYVYTIVDKTNILPSNVRENLKPTLHATFKGGGWYARWKTEEEFRKSQEQIGNKVDNEVIDDMKNDLQDYAKQEDYLNGIGEVNSSLESYKSLLETIERDLKGERDENGEFVLDADGNPINVGAIKEIEDIVNRESAIVNNLGELSERWNFIGTNIIMASEGLLIGETGVNENGKEILISGIRVGKDRIDFVEKKEIISEITGSRMKINRAIFVQSISVGEHKIETMSGGHTIWTWVPTI